MEQSLRLVLIARRRHNDLGMESEEDAQEFWQRIFGMRENHGSDGATTEGYWV